MVRETSLLCNHLFSQVVCSGLHQRWFCLSSEFMFDALSQKLRSKLSKLYLERTAVGRHISFKKTNSREIPCFCLSSDRMTWNFQSLLARRNGCMNLGRKLWECPHDQQHPGGLCSLHRTQQPEIRFALCHNLPGHTLGRSCPISRGHFYTKELKNWNEMSFGKITFSRLSAMLKARSRSHLSSSSSRTS